MATAESCDLGPLVSTHPFKLLSRVLNGLGLLAGLAVVMGYVATGAGGCLEIVAVCLLPLLWVTYCAFMMWHNWGRVVMLHEGGFCDQRKNRETRVRWSDVQSSSQEITRHTMNGIHYRTTHEYNVRTRDGSDFLFDDALADVATLGNAVQTESQKLLWPQYLEALGEGKRLYFWREGLDSSDTSAFSVALDGLACDSNHLSWREISGVVP